MPELPGEFGERVSDAGRAAGRPARAGRRCRVDGLDEALRDCPVRLSTMGRGLDEDLAYFLASAAAGRHAASLLS